MSSHQPYHRLFGLCWADFFFDADVVVETERDLSFRKQLVDLVIIRRGSGTLPRPLPDGFELAAHNLVTFKSFHEALDPWTLWELVGHFVNYRKQSSAPTEDLLPETDFRLFAVCARFPQALTKQVTLTPLREGVYDINGLGLSIRVIVINQLLQVEHNSMLHLFSAREELLEYGRKHYRPHSPDTSSLLWQLFEEYSEDPEMQNEKLKQFVRESIDDLLSRLPAEELRKHLPVEERLKGLPAEERLKGLPAEERLKGLSADDVLHSLSPEQLEALARKLKTNGSATE